MEKGSTSGRSRRLPAWRDSIRLLALAGLLATTGCTGVVMDSYRGDAMVNPLTFWLITYEQPEIHVAWSQVDPTHGSGFTTAGNPTEVMTIRPELEGCQFVEVFVNDPDYPLDQSGTTLRKIAIDADAALIPDERFPDCTVLLTYRRSEASPTFSITAATRDGVIAEFPDGKREPSWLALVPVAVLTDVITGAVVIGVLLFALDPGAGI